MTPRSSGAPETARVHLKKVILRRTVGSVSNWEVSRIGQNSQTDAYIIRPLWLSLQKI